MNNGRRNFFSSGLGFAVSLNINKADASRSVYLLSAPAPEADLMPKILGAWISGGKNYVGTWDSIGGLRGFEIDFRGHEVLQDPLHPGFGLAIARRPGDYLLKFDFKSASPTLQKKIERNRSFNGHALYSRDGKSLFTSENNLLSGKGVVGIRRSDTLEKYGEISTGDSGPHQMLLNSVNNSLFIANGGLLHIPKSEIMRSWGMENIGSSLVELNLTTGSLNNRWTLRDPFLSIRHMKMAPDLTIGIALQAAHPSEPLRMSAPVAAKFDGDAIFTLDLPKEISMRGYGGDISCIEVGRDYFYAIACPEADAVAWWDSSGNWRGTAGLKRVCAMGVHNEEIIAPTDNGEISRISAVLIGSLTKGGINVAWDNHVTILN